MLTPRAPQTAQRSENEARSTLEAAGEQGGGCRTQVVPLGWEGNSATFLEQRTLYLAPQGPAASCTLSARAQPGPPMMGKNWGFLGILEPL